jgi:hypothetical protein
MTKKRGWITAGELMAQLAQDPEYERRMAAREQARLAHVARFQAAIEPVLADLRNVGVFVEEWNDVVSRYAPLPQSVVDVLLRWLPLLDHPAVQEAVVRAIAAAPTVHYDGRVLARLFETTESESLRWAIGNTFECTKPEGVNEWILRIVQNPSFGKGREMLAIALARLVGADVANPVLVSLLRDLPIHAAVGLAVSGTSSELAALESARDRAKGSTRKEISKAIRAIERRSRRRRDHS